MQWGFGGVLTSVPHIVVPDTIAGFIGWEPGSPFQVELGFASLGLSLVGIACIWLRVWFSAPGAGDCEYTSPPFSPLLLAELI